MLQVGVYRSPRFTYYSTDETTSPLRSTDALFLQQNCYLSTLILIIQRTSDRLLMKRLLLVKANHVIIVVLEQEQLSAALILIVDMMWLDRMWRLVFNW